MIVIPNRSKQTNLNQQGVDGGIPDAIPQPHRAFLELLVEFEAHALFSRRCHLRSKERNASGDLVRVEDGHCFEPWKSWKSRGFFHISDIPWFNER